MGYVKDNLLEDEKVVYMAPIHWIIFLPSISLIFLGVAIGGLMNYLKPESSDLMFIAIPFILGGLMSFLNALIFKYSTELAVTSKRVISKSGFIRRTTHELNHSKVESLHVEQSILGRILGFGTIEVQGTGGGSAPITNIDNPMLFRKKTMEEVG